jgi:hypothetical protein
MKQKANKKSSYWREQISLAVEHRAGVRDYCEKNGIQRQALYYWKKRLAGAGPRQAFAKVEVVASSPQRLITKPGRLPDPKWLAEFLLALGQARAAM